MAEQKVEELIREFNRAAKSHYEASLAGNWRIANKEAATIRKVVLSLRSLGEKGTEALLAQTDHENLCISSMAAVYSLKYAPEKSISVLTRIAKDPGLSGFEAEQALQRWKEGEWDL